MNKKIREIINNFHDYMLDAEKYMDENKSIHAYQEYSDKGIDQAMQELEQEIKRCMGEDNKKKNVLQEYKDGYNQRAKDFWEVWSEDTY